MAEIGAFLSSEEHGPAALVTQAMLAEKAGMRSIFISDHFHPWIDRQGESPFVWSVIGAISASTSHKVTTGVTCPTVRIHPAILAQAAATSQLLLEGRFVFGIGSGEALNEHILGHRWPPVETRLKMLEEAVEVIRQLWEGGVVSHHGRYYTVENARIYSMSESPPPILVSAFGPDAADLAARIGDGFGPCNLTESCSSVTGPKGGKAAPLPPSKSAGTRTSNEHASWRMSSGPLTALEGQLSQELPMPAHFEAAAANVTEDMVADLLACGPDPEKHVEAITKYLDAGFDEVYVNQIGPESGGVLPVLRARTPSEARCVIGLDLNAAGALQ